MPADRPLVRRPGNVGFLVGPDRGGSELPVGEQPLPDHAHVFQMVDLLPADRVGGIVDAPRVLSVSTLQIDIDEPVRIFIVDNSIIVQAARSEGKAADAFRQNITGHKALHRVRHGDSVISGTAGAGSGPVIQGVEIRILIRTVAFDHQIHRSSSLAHHDHAETRSGVRAECVEPSDIRSGSGLAGKRAEAIVVVQIDKIIRSGCSQLGSQVNRRILGKYPERSVLFSDDCAGFDNESSLVLRIKPKPAIDYRAHRLSRIRHSRCLFKAHSKASFLDFL